MLKPTERRLAGEPDVLSEKFQECQGTIDQFTNTNDPLSAQLTTYTLAVRERQTPTSWNTCRDHGHEVGVQAPARLSTADERIWKPIVC